jgi:hypothetical protein
MYLCGSSSDGTSQRDPHLAPMPLFFCFLFVLPESVFHRNDFKFVLVRVIRDRVHSTGKACSSAACMRPWVD